MENSSGWFLALSGEQLRVSELYNPLHKSETVSWGTILTIARIDPRELLPRGLRAAQKLTPLISYLQMDLVSPTKGVMVSCPDLGMTSWPRVLSPFGW